MKKLFYPLVVVLSSIVSFNVQASVPELDDDNGDDLTSDLNNSYVSQAFLDYLDFNSSNSAYNSIEVSGTTFSDFKTYFEAASVAEKPGQNRKESFRNTGDLSTIPTGELDPKDDISGEGLALPLSGQGIFFISDASPFFESKLRKFVEELTIADAATNSNRQLAPSTKVVFYTTNDGPNDGNTSNDGFRTYDVAGISDGGPAIVNVPIDGGLSFLALGGLAFGAARFRRRK